MPVQVRFAKSALTDLQTIQTWYAEQGVPDVGARLVGDIVKRIERLADHPDVGRVVPEFGQTFLREIIYPRFASCIGAIQIPCGLCVYGAVNASFG